MIRPGRQKRHSPEGDLRLHIARGATHGALWIERLWPLLLPLVLVLGVFASLAWLGIFRFSGEWVRFGLVCILALAALAALWPLRLFRRPTAIEVDARLERSNGLVHAPLRTQYDRLSAPDEANPFAAALWREHQRRLAAGLKDLSGDAPHTGVPERDPWGVRAAVALLVVVAFSFSLGPSGGSLSDAFRAPALAQSVPPRIDAWVTPPAYTGMAPVYLTAEAYAPDSVFEVPAGSTFVVRVSGGGSASLGFTDAASTEETVFEDAVPAGAEGTAGEPAREFSGTIDNDGLLTLRDGPEGAEIDSWSFAVIPDRAPAIRFAEEPSRALNGALELTYEIEDDYGAVEAKALFALADKNANARPLYEAPEMRLSLPRGEEGEAARTVENLTAHPWAGSLVDVVLEARDASGQSGRSEPVRLELPQRPFTHPLALALIEQRRLLALNANAKSRVLDLIDAITLRPEATIPDPVHYLGVVTAQTRLELAESDEALRGVVDYLWEVAVRIEDGELTDAERRLRMAQEALREALEEGASEEEIEELMAELRAAMDEFLREFAQRALENPEQAMPMPQDGQMLSQSDLEQMLDELEELAKSGARDQAQELLSQLENMMNNLQAGRQPNQGGGEQSQMRQQMDELGELMRRQQELMNETFRMQQGQGQPGGEGQQPMSPEELAEALRGMQQGQGQLRSDLQSLMEGLEGMGIQPGEGFGEAGEAMGRAGEALGEGQGERAVGEQGQALEALRRGAQDMMQQMQAMQGENGGSEQGGRSRRSADRDPLGRPRATTGPDFGETTDVPDEIDAQRARQILEAIRERLGNAFSPELEREYLERLLEMR